MRRKIADMEEGASNAKINVAINKDLEGLRLKTDPSILKLFPKPKSVDSDNFKNLFKLRESNFKLASNDGSSKRLNVAPAFKKIPELKLSPTLKKFSESKPLKPLGVTVPKWGLSKSWKQIDDSDLKTAPSNVDKKIVEVTKGRSVPRLGLPHLLPLDLSATRKAPFAFRNLLKLKDVELIPPKTTKVNIELPSLKPATRAKHKLISSPVDNDCDLNREKVSTLSNIQFIPRGKKGKTEILDALPSASENNEVITASQNPAEQQDSLVESGSGIIIMDVGQQTNDDSETATTNDEELDAETNQNIEHSPTLQRSKVPKGVDQDFDSYDDNLELIVNENGGSNIDEIIFDIENDPSNSEIIIDEEIIPEIEEFNEDLDVTTQDNDESILERSDFDELIHNDEEIITNDHVISSDSVILDKNVENKANAPVDSEGAAACNCKAKMMPVQENEFSEENRNAETLKLGELPKENINPKFKESIILRLNNQHNGKILSFSKLKEQDETNNAESNERSSLSESSHMEDEHTETHQTTADSDSGINTKNLQDFTNSHLHESKSDEDVRASNIVECKSNNNQALNPNDPSQLMDENETFDNSDESIHTSDLVTLGSTPHTDIIETVTDSNVPSDLNLETNASGNVPNENLKQDDLQISDNDKESPCQAHINSFKSATSEEELTKNLSTESKPQEMEVGASETFPTLSQQVLEPSSLFNNPIPSPPALPSLGDLISGIPPLPAVPYMADIASSMSNLFGSNNQEAKDLSSAEFDPDTDGTDDNPVMSTDASTDSKSTILEWPNPLENINLDIFQVNPLSQSKPFTYNIPSLNLNSFKTKLALPQTFDLRPGKLQSTLGKDGSLLGATLTFGPSKLGKADAKMPMFKTLLVNPLRNLPDLEELSIPRINPLETLQATKTLGENIRSHTENTVRNLQHSLASTLNGARINQAGEKLATPRFELLEMVSNAHEDMKDKLLGIHTDLKDRLETFQDHIKERAKWPTLRMPLLDVLKLESPFSETTSSSNLRASQPTKHTKSQRKPGFRVNKPSQNSRTEHVKPIMQETNLRPFKMSKAASSLKSKSVEVPQLTVTSVKPLFAKPLQRDSNVKLRESKPSTINEPGRLGQNRPLLKLAENGSPNLRPVTTSTLFRPKSTPTISSATYPSIQGNERLTTKLSKPKFKSKFDIEDTSGFASEVKTSVVKPARSNDVFVVPDSNQLQPSSGPASSPKTSGDRIESEPSFIKNKELTPGKLPILKNPFFKLPKPTESHIIARLRESLKPKLSSPKIKDEVNPPTKDMAKSASEDNAVVLSKEPMKENVSYKCKMMCYRER